MGVLGDGDYGFSVKLELRWRKMEGDLRIQDERTHWQWKWTSSEAEEGESYAAMARLLLR